MTAPSTVSLPRTMHRALCVALIIVQVSRVLQLSYKWSAGVSPAYPGQYGRRLLSALISAGILGAVLVGQSAFRNTTRGRFAYWVLLGTALGVQVGQVIADL